MSSEVENIALEELEKAASFELVGGLGAGKVFSLSQSRVAIGREPDNDIILSGESVSRHHAIIERTTGGDYRIFDNGSKNGVLINGEKVEVGGMVHGDLVQIGAFTFRFVFGEDAAGEVEEARALEAAGEVTPDIVRRASKTVPNGNKKRILIYGLGLLLLAGLYRMSTEETENAETKKTDDKFKVSDNPKFENEKSSPGEKVKTDPLMSATEQELSKLDWSNSSVQEAEAYFRKGQREYFNKNYHRAIDNFKASLAIYRSHPLSQYYLQAAIHDAEVEAKKHYEIGVKYFESLQYSRAVYHFNEAIQLMSHRAQDPVIKNAEKYIDLSKRKLQSVEMFP